MERHLDEEFDQLKEKLLRMAALTEEAISLAITSLKERKGNLAQLVKKSEDTWRESPTMPLISVKM